MSGLATYRQQQGGLTGGSDLHGADPVVINWAIKSAHAHGVPVDLVLATMLQEAGAQRGRVGDRGSSFGPLQLHRGGALGSHTPAWANSYAGVDSQIAQFGRYHALTGKGIAAVQRPFDPAGYAAGVDGLRSKAREILAAYGLHPVAVSSGSTPNPKGRVQALGKSQAQAQGSYVSGGSVGINANNRVLGLPSMPSLDVFVPSSSPASPSPSAPVRATPTTPASTPAPAPAGAGGPRSKAVGNFEGTQVMAWMVPALRYARAKGWKGTLTSGIRGRSEQAQLYARYRAGGNIAAPPGQSNHEIQNGGAFDASDAPQLAAILKSFTGQRPIWAKSVGLDDTPHFSLTGR